jgi:hypothetical protein
VRRKKQNTHAADSETCLSSDERFAAAIFDTLIGVAKAL